MVLDAQALPQRRQIHLSWSCLHLVIQVHQHACPGGLISNFEGFLQIPVRLNVAARFRIPRNASCRPLRFLVFSRIRTSATRQNSAPPQIGSRPGVTLVVERVPATAELALTAMVLAVGLAVPLRPGRPAPPHDHRPCGALVLHSRPIDAHVLARADRDPRVWRDARRPPTGGIGGLQHLDLPAVVLGVFSSAGILRLTRAAMLTW